MRSVTVKPVFPVILSLLVVLFMAQAASAATIEAVQVATVGKKSEGSKSAMDSIGTDSKGSYSYPASKAEGSKGRRGQHMAPSPPRSPGYSHGKREGSGSKGYSHGGPGYSRHGYKKPCPHKARGHRADSHGSFFHKRTSPFKHLLRFKCSLKLTEDQINKIHKLEFEFKKTRIRADADHAIAHLELDRLVHGETIDESRIRALADEIAAIKSRTIHAMAEAKIALLKILTAEQRKKVSKMHSAH